MSKHLLNLCADELAEEIRLARVARAWEIISGGRLVPSPEDRKKHEALLGPMPQYERRV